MSSNKTALLSVYHKDGIVEFARRLVAMGWNILASGGTAKALAAGGVPVRDVAELVGGGPILGHRVVTLSREIHAGLLATEAQRPELERMNIPWIDLVCVDLYPLEEEIARAGSTPESVRELTDIGGPTLLRSAAKGGRIVIGDSANCGPVLAWLTAGQPDSAVFLRRLVAEAEKVAARYTLASAFYLGQGQFDGMVGNQVHQCAYGENAWQHDAALYSTGLDDPLALDRFELVAGSPPSYNNLCDLDRLLQTITHIAAAFDVNGSRSPCIAVGVKHGNACGVAIADEPYGALTAMLEGNLRSIMGGLVMVNFPLSQEAATTLLHHSMTGGQPRLLDGVVAPSFADGATAMFARKRGKCRLFANTALAKLDRTSLDSEPRIRYVRGGFLRQGNYTAVLNYGDPALVWHGEPTSEQRVNLLLAWAVGATSNSNTVTIVKNGQLIGNGVGQQDRIEAASLAVRAPARRVTIRGEPLPTATASSRSTTGPGCW